MTGDPWRRYLDEIGRIPLLTREEVVAAARRLEAGEQARIRLAADPPPGPDEAAALTETAADGARAKELLVTSNLRLVVAVARRFRPGGQGLPDLVQEGAFGLIRAVEKFDHRRGTAFSTYATWWIRQAIGRAVAEQSRSVRVPKHVNDELAACVRARDALAERCGGEPSVVAVAAACGVDRDRVGVLLRWVPPAESLQALAEAGRSVGLAEPDLAPPDPVDSAVQRVQRGQLRDRLDAALDRLPDRHQSVLRERVGWFDGQPRGVQAVAVAHGISRDAVRRLESEGRAMLREQAQLAALRDWVDP